MFSPSTVATSSCDVNAAFQPPSSVKARSTRTTASPEPVYVPIATRTVSPAAAFPIAPLIVAHGCAGVAHELRSIPVGATYQVADAALAPPAAPARTTA